jgi:hypothetical protein
MDFVDEIVVMTKQAPVCLVTVSVTLLHTCFCSLSPTTTLFMNHKCLQNIRDHPHLSPVQTLLTSFQ